MSKNEILDDRDVSRQLYDTYLLMASCGYRPEAPSDGCGNIMEFLKPGDVEREAERFAVSWWKKEDSGELDFGYPDHQSRPELILAHAACELFAGGSGGEHVALALLEKSAELVRRRMQF